MIFFLSQEGKSGAEIHTLLNADFGDCALSRCTLFRKLEELRDGRESLEGLPRSGRLRTSRTPLTIPRAQALLNEDRGATLEDVHESFEVPHGKTHSILTNYLGVTKVSARWVPNPLRRERQSERVGGHRSSISRSRTTGRTSMPG